MKSHRLIAVLLALQHTGKLSATALADDLEVSVRTIYRDIDALSAAGVPIYAERGSRGGIVLADGYRDALARFHEDELRALFVSSDDALADLGIVGGRRSALEKLARVMPDRVRKAVGKTRGRVHVDSRRWMGGASMRSASLDALRDAVWNDHRATIAYTNRSGAATRRTIDPLGLVTKAGVWYLVARDRETVKTFRVQRIARVRVHDQCFVRPSSFDVGEYWNASMAQGGAVNEAPFVATFQMSRRALANVSMYHAIESRTRVRGSTPAAWVVRVAFASFMSAVHEALSWGEDALAIEPPSLCRWLAEHGRWLAQRYAMPSTLGEGNADALNQPRETAVAH
jgi:predicted DNA-binding transcriptional regulator YafY